MNRRGNRLVAICVAAIFLAFVAFLTYLQNERISHQHQNLLADLDMPDVAYISIYASYGKETALLSESDAAEIVHQLNTVNLIGSGTQDYATDFSLRPSMFHICRNDGVEYDFSAWEPYYIINTETFGEKFGYSLEGGNAAVTGSGYRIPGARHSRSHEICIHLRQTYDALCREYFPRRGET